jgi:hypothetical protein
MRHLRLPGETLEVIVRLIQALERFVRHERLAEINDVGLSVIPDNDIITM